MASPLTPAQVIQYTNVATYLASDAVAKGNLFGASIEPELPNILYIENFILNWYNSTTGNNSVTDQAIANYVWSLTGMYGITAQAIVTGGGGTVTPGTPTIAPAPYQFEVSSTSFIPTGDSSKTISDFIGYNLLFVRDNITQSTVNTGGTYYSWNSVTGLFTCVGAAGEGQLFQLFAV